MPQKIDIDAILRPVWLPASALVFNRIDSFRPSNPDTVNPATPGDLTPRLVAATEPRDMTPEELGDWIADDTDAGVPTFAPVSRSTDPLPGPRYVGVRTRLTLLRMCAAFGEAPRLAQIAKPGTITLIEGVPAACFDAVTKLMVAEIFGLARSLGGAGKAGKAEVIPKAILLAPRSSDGTVSATELGRLDTQFGESLEGTAPVVVMLPAGVMPSQALLATAPLRIALPPMDRAMLMQFFAKTHPSRVKASARAIITRLPSDDQLARISDITLMAALRQGDPRDVADALTSRFAQVSGPQLADLPDSPAVRAATALVADLKAWAADHVTWDDIPHSLLLHGPAGTGKSFIARAMANEPGIRFVSASFAEWQAADKGHLGTMLSAMGRSFAEAVAAAPCVFFIDEIDSAGSRSGADGHGASYRRQVVNGFLLAIDQLNAAGGVILVGACNSPDALDPAILRPGRFDRKIAVPLPHRAAIAAVLKRGLGTALNDQEVDQLSQRLIGESMASVDALMRNARSAARLAGRPLGLADLENAMPGPAPAPAITRRVAIHEAGHALVNHILGVGRVTRVSLRGGGGDGGLTERLLAHTEGTEAELDDYLTVDLAGRAAEQTILGSVSSGAGGPPGSDLARATRLAEMVETQFGLGASGLVWLEQGAMRDPVILRRIRLRLEAAEARALALIEAHCAGVLAIADALVAEGELSGRRLDDLLATFCSPARFGETGEASHAC
jgi:DNA polymerase III delta prime subunit